MKRLLVSIAVILVALPIILGSLLAASYYNTEQVSIPNVQVEVLGKKLSASGYRWNQPVMWGLMFRPLTQVPAQPQAVGTLKSSTLEITTPASYQASATVYRRGYRLWHGEAASLNEYRFTENGEYVLEVTCEKPEESTFGFGQFSYLASFTVQAAPRLATGAGQVRQGDVLPLGVLNVPEGQRPTGDGMGLGISFVPLDNGRFVGFLPVSCEIPEGEYSYTVRLEGEAWSGSFTVLPSSFDRQDISVDSADPSLAEAGGWAAMAQYQEVIPPLWGTADENRYWQGSFLRPAPGRLSTTYGTQRYTNGSYTPEVHPAVDIAAPEGTKVIAPAAGRVVLAASLLNTGNTLVIEHGGGLKSYFYHMQSISVAEGAMVKRGAQVGTVGSTGYSTGAHLHYEVRIGNQSINPTWLFEGNSNLYYFS